MLSSIGGAAGLLAALWGVDAINAVMPPNLLPVPDVRIDATVLVFAVVLTIATGLLFGIAPAWHAATTDLNEVLKQIDARVERRAAASAQRACGGGARARDDSVDRRRTADAEPAPPAAREPRVPSRSTADLPGLAAAGQVSGREEHGVLSQRCRNRCARRRASAPRRCRAESRSETAAIRRRRFATTGPSLAARGHRRPDRLAHRDAGVLPRDGAFRCCADAIHRRRRGGESAADRSSARRRRSGFGATPIRLGAPCTVRAIRRRPFVVVGVVGDVRHTALSACLAGDLLPGSGRVPADGRRGPHRRTTDGDSAGDSPEGARARSRRCRCPPCGRWTSGCRTTRRSHG